MLKTFMKKLLLIILLGVAVIGCRGGGPQSETRPTPISAPPAAEGGGGVEEGGGVGQPLTLRLWAQQNEAFNAANQALVDGYVAANPGVTISIEMLDAASYESTVQSALLAGNAADIIQLPGSAACANSAYLAPAPEAVATQAGALAGVVDGPLSSFVCEGVLYGLPQESAAPWGLVVSRTSLAQEVAWDFARLAALDPINAAAWNATSGTQPTLPTNGQP